MHITAKCQQFCTIFEHSMQVPPRTLGRYIQKRKLQRKSFPHSQDHDAGDVSLSRLGHDFPEIPLHIHENTISCISSPTMMFKLAGFDIHSDSDDMSDSHQFTIGV